MNSTPASHAAFHAHLDVCERCRRQPFDLCVDGSALLKAVKAEVVEAESVKETDGASVSTSDATTGSRDGDGSSSAHEVEKRTMICLNMIVRNEAKILERALASVASFIAAYVIVDTGSTDGTPDLIRTFFEKRGIPGEVHHAPFVDFSQARNAALAAARASSLPFTHLLLMDADMELRVLPGHEEWHRSLDQGAYLLSQECGLRYDNTRILARTQPAAYVGKTHEYLAIPGIPLHTFGRIPAVWFLDHAEGSSRSEKYTRDIRLLKEALAENPSDVRAMFYLANTLQDLAGTLDDGVAKAEDGAILPRRRETYAEALRWYAARVAAGGWDEEVWCALYNQAKCHKALGDEAAMDAAALKAYEFRPSRAEPLYLLALHYRWLGRSRKALLFANAGAPIPESKDALFVETYPYRWGLREEISISGFYSPPDRDAARLACHALARDPAAPGHTRQLARSNLVHYAQSLTALAGGVAVRLDVKPWTDDKAHDDVTRSKWSAATPSVAWLPPRQASQASPADASDRLACTVRWHNYRFSDGAYRSNDADGIVRTETDILILDRNSLAIQERKPIREACAIQRTGFHVRGFEDLRLFKCKSGGESPPEVLATATARDLSSDGHAEIVLLTLHETDDAWEIRDYRVLPRVQADAYEKNWMPVSIDGEPPRFVAHVDPPTVFNFVRFTVGAPLTMALDDARGGGQILDLRPYRSVLDHWDSRLAFLGIVHMSQTSDANVRSYTHSFLGFDKDLRAVAESPTFHLREPGLEFAAGLCLKGRELLVSYHFRDREAWIHRLSLNAVLQLLRPLSPLNVLNDRS